MRGMIFALLAAVLLSVPAGAVTLRSQEKAYPIDEVRRVRFDFSVGSLHIEATDGNEVQVQVFVECKRRSNESCERRAKKIRITAKNRGDVLAIKIDGMPKFNLGSLQVECQVKVPRSLDLAVEMGVGELIIRDIGGDLEVDLGVGEVDVALGEGDVGTVKVNVGIGEASFSGPAGRKSVSGLFGRKITWAEGAGASRVDVSLGVGEATVRLE